jgi:hypothetical protein
VKRTLRIGTEPRAVASGITTQLTRNALEDNQLLRLSLYPARYCSRFCIFSAFRCTDFVSVPTDPSDKSPGYFQPSAKRGLSGTDLLGKSPST